jgi:hypothetical protein
VRQAVIPIQIDQLNPLPTLKGPAKNEIHHAHPPFSQTFVLILPFYSRFHAGKTIG